MQSCTKGSGEGQTSQDSQVSRVGPGGGKLCNHCGGHLLRVLPALTACGQGPQAVLNVWVKTTCSCQHQAQEPKRQLEHGYQDLRDRSACRLEESDTQDGWGCGNPGACFIHFRAQMLRKVKVAQSCPILGNSSGQKNTGVGSLSLLQEIFPTQGSNPGLPHCGRILYLLSHRGSPGILEWVAYPFSSGPSWPRNTNQGLLYCRRILYQLSYGGSPMPGKLV